MTLTKNGDTFTTDDKIVICAYKQNGWEEYTPSPKAVKKPVKNTKEK